MKHHPQFLVLVCLAALSFGACSDSSTEPTVDKFEALTAKPWKVVSYTEGGTDMTQIGPKELTFKVDSTVKWGEYSVPWEFASNESQIVLNKGESDERTWDIVDLTSSSLKLKKTQFLLGVPFTTTLAAVPK